MLDCLFGQPQHQIRLAQNEIARDKTGIQSQAPLSFDQRFVCALLRDQHARLGMMSVIGVRVDRKRARCEFVAALDVGIAIDALHPGDPRRGSFCQNPECANIVRVDRQSTLAKLESGLRFTSARPITQIDRFACEGKVLSIAPFGGAT